MFSYSYFFLILNILFCTYQSIQTANTYIYLSDKHIHEEQDPLTLVCDLTHESKQKDGVSYTLLDDSKTSYFILNSSRLLTRQKIDREFMCSNNLCADPCNLSTYSKESNESCRLNLKILVMPSYSILNLNVFIQDINDNKPLFRNSEQIIKINENVPIGYKIPLELAYDPDVNENTVQKYELDNGFDIEQNLADSKLNLVVSSSLDREKKSYYELKLTAYDNLDRQPPSSLTLKIEILDENDNSPIFHDHYYKFQVKENSPIDTLIGQVYASDLDFGLNGLVKYKFVDSSLKRPTIKKFNNKYFYLNETTGEIRLKNTVDYEEENFFSLVIEAKDSSETDALTDYTSVDIEILDENDNGPEISVSYLNTNFKNVSVYNKVDHDFKYDLYIPENVKPNKFIAHVSIFDKDSPDNSKFKFKVLLNGEENKILKINQLNNNSFTLNIGRAEMFDYELNEDFNVSILAWDVNNFIQNVYKFRIVLLDVNDNAPKFERDVYNLTFGSPKPGDVLLNLTAVDRDKGSIVGYEINGGEDFVEINKNSVVMKNNFTDLSFFVIAYDNGQPSLSSKSKVNIRIRPDTIEFTTSFKHFFEDHTLIVKINRNIESRVKIIEFDSEIDFLVDLKKLGFELDHKSLVLTRKLDRKFINLPLRLRDSNRKFFLRLEISDESDLCLNTYQLIRTDTGLIFDKFNEVEDVFDVFYTPRVLTGSYGILSESQSNDLDVSLLTEDLIILNLTQLTLKYERSSTLVVYRLTLGIKSVKNLNFRVRVTPSKESTCLIEDNFVMSMDDDVLKMSRNYGKKAKSFMYKLSTTRVKFESPGNFLTLLLTLMCILIVFFVTLSFMILKYFNHYKYKKNLKKTTTMIQKEFNLKSDDDKNQRKILKQQTYMYTPYSHPIKEDNYNESVRYVHKVASFSNKTFNPRQSVEKKSSDRFSCSDDGGFMVNNHESMCIKSPKNSIKVKISI